ncbi:MAG: hypothetical protein ACE5IK_11630 [Acidobacteriota bacterium]
MDSRSSCTSRWGWRGIIGLSGVHALLDGGSVLVSEFRFMSTDGEWAVENEGVSPDIEVSDAVVRIILQAVPAVLHALGQVTHPMQGVRTGPSTGRHAKRPG